MEDYTINYDKGHYPDLLVQCVHDTHHDFFYNKDPMKLEIQKGGATAEMSDVDTQSSSLTDEEGQKVVIKQSRSGEGGVISVTEEGGSDDSRNKKRKDKSDKNKSTLTRQDSVPIYKTRKSPRCTIRFNFPELDVINQSAELKENLSRKYDVPINITGKGLNDIMGNILKEGDMDVDSDKNPSYIFYNLKVGQLIKDKKIKTWVIQDSTALDDIVKKNREHFNFERSYNNPITIYVSRKDSIGDHEVPEEEFDEPVDDYYDNPDPYESQILESLRKWSYLIDMDNDIYSFVSMDKLYKIEEEDKIKELFQEILFCECNKKNMQRGGERTKRVRALPANIKDKIVEYQSKLIPIFKKTQTWDIFGISVVKPEYAVEERSKYDKLNHVNMGSSLVEEDKIKTFYDWLTDNGYFTGKAKRVPNILVEINTAINTYDPTKDLRSINFIFYTMIEKYLEEEPIEANELHELEKLFLVIKSFSKYTSLPSDIMSNYLDVKINIDTFIKKKWNKYRATYNSQLDDFFGKGKKATLSDDDISAINTFEYTVMQGWLTSIGLDKQRLSVWAKNEYDKIVKDKKEKITDTAIRDDYLGSEFGIKPKLRQGMFKWNKGEETEKLDKDLLPLSIESYGNKTFGNNATATKFYSENGDWERLKPQLKNPLMKETLDYNCNSPNVADPASSCPELSRHDDDDVDITLNAGSNNVIVYKLEGAKLKKDLTKCKMSYMIKYGDKEIKMDNYPVNTMNNKGKKVEGLSKSTVMSHVFKKLKGIVEGSGVSLSKGNSEILQEYNKLDASKNDITRIIQIFCLKLFGDFGQELYFAALSKDKESVYIGNDWISYIRGLQLLKYMVRKAAAKGWYCGFLGNVGFNIIYSGSSRGSSRKTRSRISKRRKRRSRSRRSRRRTKRRTRRSRRRTKRRTSQRRKRSRRSRRRFRNT